MIYLLLPFFLIRLFAANLYSVLSIFWELLKGMSSLFTTIALGLLCIATFLLSFSLRQKKVTLPAFVQMTPLDFQDVQKEIVYWENISQKQPTSRDVLWNLSELYRYAGDTEKAQEYLQKAKEVDPNANLFKVQN
jgi:tetratricopeptide (TPR) repeat protein